ncbi:S26 family signal peptidase [Microbacterium sp. X-17]|uniref:S26 family signal peptidase n=1 Tax=Microbacterium sp. X-17 TaxID=3144404 RepID=UPI0031F51CB3
MPPPSRCTAVTTMNAPARTRARLAAIIAAGLVGALIAILVASWSAGWRWFIVESPSMGRTAPVGTLVVTTPVAASAVHVGDVITFDPPTSPDETYTHRVREITPTGQLITRGDINGATDPWQLSGHDLVGRAAAILPGWGWLIRSLPFLFVGGVVVWALTDWFATARWRAPLRVIGASLVFAVTAAILRPFVGVMVLATQSTHHGANATLVSTGLLPIHVQAVGGTGVDLVSGQVGSVHVPRLADDGYYHLAATPTFNLLGWIIVGIVCAAPLLWCLIVGLPGEEPQSAEPRPDEPHRGRTRLGEATA